MVLFDETFELFWRKPAESWDIKWQRLTRGIQAALPNIDHFLRVHNLASLEDLAIRLVDLEKKP